MTRQPNINIMAPVGCWDSLAAAIEAGAGSVYFGIDSFNNILPTSPGLSNGKVCPAL